MSSLLTIVYVFTVLLVSIIIIPMAFGYFLATVLGFSSAQAWHAAAAAGILTILVLRYHGRAGDAVLNASADAKHKSVPAHNDLEAI